MPRPSRSAVAALLLFLCGLTIARAVSLPETDIFWSIRYGQDLLSGGAFAPVERWDFSDAGEVWIPNSWAWNVLLALFWKAGPLGLGLFAALCFAGACSLAWALLTRLKASFEVKALTVPLFAISQVLFFTVRATAADVLLLLGFALVLTYPRLRRLNWLLPLAFAFSAVGANLHLSAPIYVALFAAFTLLLKAEQKQAQRWGKAALVALVTAAGTFCTPFGIEGLAKVLSVTSASRGVITEWGPPQPTTQIGIFIISLLVLSAIYAVRLLVKRAWLEAALIIAFAIATGSAIRFALYLSVIVLIVFAERAGGDWKLPFKLTARNAALLKVLSGAFFAIAIGFAIWTVGALGPNRIVFVNPTDFKPFAPHSRVLSDPSTGSTLILYRPDVQVASDSRNDLLGAKRYTEISDLYYYAPTTQLRAWLERNRVDGVWVGTDAISALTPRMKALHWQAHPGQYGVAWTRP